jgi:hypothetical protein
MAQQPANQQPADGASAGALIGATGPAIGADAEFRATMDVSQSQTSQSDSKRVARYQYYWWHGNCYCRYPSGDYVLVPPGYCS